MDDLKKLLWAFPVGVIISLYTAFVIENLWNWFAVPALHVPEISFWGIYGLVLLVSLLGGDKGTGDRFATQQVWTNVGHALDACIPEGKREGVMQLIKEENEGIWLKAGFEVCGKVVGSTLTLIIGWAVHTFLV